jgi:hypothetical protein
LDKVLRAGRALHDGTITALPIGYGVGDRGVTDIGAAAMGDAERIVEVPVVLVEPTALVRGEAEEPRRW